MNKILIRKYNKYSSFILILFKSWVSEQRLFFISEILGMLESNQHHPVENRVEGAAKNPSIP